MSAPLDGITDSPFRQLVRDFSQDELLYTEMRHVGCIANDKGKTRALVFKQLERPLSYQVAANDVKFIAKACERILATGIDIVDLNVGCPARNVTGSGSGSALMGDLPRLERILKEFRRLLAIPLTIKIRAGYKSVNAVEVAKLAQDCGVDALAIHPRLQTQRFEGVPNYALAAEVKKALTIPVIISGGIVNWRLAKMVYEQTGVDGFLVGRGMWAQAWKLKELKEHSLGNFDYKASKTTIFSYALKHLDKMIEYYGPAGIFVFRKHLPFYLRGFTGAVQIRKRLIVTKSFDEIKNSKNRISLYKSYVKFRGVFGLATIIDFSVFRSNARASRNPVALSKAFLTKEYTSGE